MIRPTRFRSRNWTRRLCIALAVLLSLGIAAEALLRAYPRPAAQGASEIAREIKLQSQLGTMVYAPDPDLGALLAPSLRKTIETPDFTYTLQTDHAGFPNPEPWPSRLDVAVLGDSLLIGPGIGMSGQFTSLLERRLNSRTVLNLGIPGSGTGHDYLVYRKYAEPLRPRLVIAVVSPAWDIDNTLHFERWRAEGSDPGFTKYRKSYRATHRSGWDLVKRQLARSHLVRAVHRGVKSLLDTDPHLQQVTFPNGDTIFLSTRQQKRLAQGMARANAPNLRKAFFRPLERLRTAVEDHSGRFVVALLPSKEELYAAEAFPAVLRSVREVRSGLESRGLAVLDLYPVFRELGQQRPPFYRADIHLNELGNQIVAAALEQWIADEEIFARPPAASVAATGPTK